MVFEKHGPVAAVCFLAGWKFIEFCQWSLSGSRVPYNFQSLGKESEECNFELRKIIELQAVKAELEYRVHVLFGLNLLWLALFIVIILWITRCCRCCLNRSFDSAQTLYVRDFPERHPRPALADAAPPATTLSLAGLGGSPGVESPVISPSSKAAVWKRQN